MSLPEVLLWRLLRGSPSGIRFRRQQPLGHFVADFYCPAAKIVIEIDGAAHAAGDRGARDERRDGWIEKQGLRILRVPAADVLADATSVADALIDLCRPSTTQLR